ncbi:hypothetical protein [Paenibacillus anaericanus]|uniref:hypothetical protein n=1 Tax=Paenibacillus anaericanus TaxID=170367 RepID=UPI0014777B08|nr:hypothetical protein [Paenibacillus anaericanus]
MDRSPNQIEISFPYRKKVLTPSPATLNPTGREGEHEGVNHTEFELLDGAGARISLAAGAVTYIKKDGVNLTPDDQETIWFSDDNLAGEYIFEVLTVGGKFYTAALDWIPTP